MSDGAKVSCASIRVKKVVAVNNRQPSLGGGGDRSYVIVEADVGNPGVSLSLRNAGGTGSLVLDLVGTQAPGLHQQVITERKARIGLDAHHDSVTVRCDGDEVGDARFQDVH